MQDNNENIKYNDKNNVLLLSFRSQENKQITANVKDSKLSKNRIAAKNEKLQNVICSQIDNQIASVKKSEYRQNRKAERQAKRK